MTIPVALLTGMSPTVVLYGVSIFIAIIFGLYAAEELIADKTARRWPLLLILLGLLLRLGWIAYTQPAPVSDYLGYWGDALRFVGGDFSFPRIDKHPGIVLQMFYLLKVFHIHYWAVWALNLFWSALVLVLIHALTRLAFGNRAAILALGLAAIQPQLIAYSALFASELPTLFFYLLLPWAVLRTRRALPVFPACWWTGLGFCLYAAVLTRSTSLLFLPLIGVLLLCFDRHRGWAALRRYALMAVVALMLLGTWVAHQASLAGKPGLFWGGEIWLVSTTHYPTQGRLVDPHHLPVLRQRFQREVPPGLSLAQQNLREFAIMKDYANAIIRRDPWVYLSQGVIRLRHILWTTSETGIRDTQFGSDALQALPEKTVTRWAEISKQYWRLLLILSCLGWLAWPWRPQPETRPVLLLLGGFLAVWLPFHYLLAVASDRWAVQIIPYTVILAAGGVCLTIDRVGKRFRSR